MKPAAWVRNLTDAQPHCVTDLKYMSAADVDAGVQYVPLYAAREWQGLTTAERKALWNATKKPSEFAELIEAKLREKNV